MKRSTVLGAAAFSLALAGGGAAGALLGTPVVSGAQDDTTTTAPADDEARPGRGGPIRAFRGDCLEAAAEALGISTDELREQLRDGRTIADVAEERGVAVDDVVEAMVAAGTERLQEAIEELPERMTALVEGELPRRGPRRAFGPGAPDGPLERWQGEHRGPHGDGDADAGAEEGDA